MSPGPAPPTPPVTRVVLLHTEQIVQGLLGFTVNTDARLEVQK